MDAVVVINGLGNQMSQYAFYLQKKKLSSSTALVLFCNEHNGFELNKVFGLNIQPSLKEKVVYVIFRLLIIEKLKFAFQPVKKVLQWLNVKIVRENYDYNFKEEFLKEGSGINYYFGGWHTEKYFLGVKEEVTKKFQFATVDDETNLNYIKKIESTNSVSLHVRRGDYLNNANVNLFGCVATLEYYQNAVDFMELTNPDCHFFVFSNDISWVKENLSMKNVTFVNGNSGVDSWKDMFLMTLCQHNIIANSTFSWWGAWLNKNQNKLVLCPSRFLATDTHTEVYPDTWIKIEG